MALALADGTAPVVAEGTACARRGDFPARIVEAFADKYNGWDVRLGPTPESVRVLLEVPVRRWLLAGAAQ